MADYLLESLGLLLRWLHVVAAIAWIGESFYFVMLDRSLKPAADGDAAIAGEQWSVHGGGFYRKQKLVGAPAQMPADLHWSKWKAYTTWLSGFALLSLLYLSSPQMYLVDPGVNALGSDQAVLAAIALLVLAWLGYDLLCRLCGFREGLLGALVALWVIGLCLACTGLFAGRAAYLLVGAALGTIMAANVFFVIIPGQRRMVAALGRGEAVDPVPGLRGKQRSVHNTYFTLPVVFAMLSVHYATAYAHPHNAWVLILFMAAAALIRQFFVVWHSGKRAWGLLGVGSAILLATFAWLAPTRNATSAVTPNSAVAAPMHATELPAADTAEIQKIMKLHCTACHSAQPSLMASAPKDLRLDEAQQIERHAVLIRRQVVDLRIMPPGNITSLSEAERLQIARWADALAVDPTFK
jgi:uncharacterized membrane protein